MKKVLAALAAASLLAACSSGTNANSGSSGDNQTLTIASVDQGSIEPLVEAFKAANPGVTINLTTSGADAHQQQIRTQLASGTGPDVMSVWPGNGNPGATYVLAKPGYLLDLSDRPWASRLPESFQKLAQYEGKTYNGLFGLNGIGAVYNDEAMTKAGLTAPGTWTDLLAFCKAAKDKGTPAYALGIQDNWVTQLAAYALVATTVYSADKEFDTKMAAGQATFAGSPWTTAMAKYEEMNSAGCFQRSPLSTSYEASQTLAATGKTLGIIQGNWVVALLKGKNPSGKFTMKALPATDDAAQFLMPAAAGMGYGVNAKAKNKELAIKFVDFVMSPQGMKTITEAQGSLPTLPDAGTTVDPGLAELTTFVNDNRTVPFMDQLWPNAKVQQTLLSGLQEVFSSQATADEVLKDMDTDYKAGA
ncbi:extracellular solute-binding protein [Actinoplanes sp. NPDC051861]|uniref:extracellular solute-binding protein n=1 Tax=Actinoplanes sp. NPDC051861 TaxID=3155170 RepID=UPI00342B9005